MPKIYSEKEPLAIDRVTIAKPVSKNGSHFIKTLDVDDPIYYLAPKCFVRQGFVNHGKKVFCDLVFSHENSEFFSWLENLEEKVKAGIYEHRDKWFETALDEHDIDSSMTPPYKPYKSGKFFIIRANVPTALGKINIKVYDENEEETDAEAIKENTHVLAVLEFQGIRCGVRSFQFEIELKQLLIVEPEKIFEKCVIASGVTKQRLPAAAATINIHRPGPEPPTELAVDIDDARKEAPPTDELHSAQIEDPLPEPAATEIEVSSPRIIDMSGPIEMFDEDFPLDNSEPSNQLPIRLKSRNDVYYKLYKETRQRAKEAKREALANYLEAKRIKTTYLLEDVSDDESDLDDLGTVATSSTN